MVIGKELTQFGTYQTPHVVRLRPAGEDQPHRKRGGACLLDLSEQQAWHVIRLQGERRNGGALPRLVSKVSISAAQPWTRLSDKGVPTPASPRAVGAASCECSSSRICPRTKRERLPKSAAHVQKATTGSAQQPVGSIRADVRLQTVDQQEPVHSASGGAHLSERVEVREIRLEVSSLHG